MRTFEKPPLPRERLEKIKILAFDMDDTLLDARGELSAGNRAVLLRAVQKGYHVVIASGRVLAALPKDVLAVEGIQYAITSNGARVTDLRTGEILFENLLSPACVDAVQPWLHDDDVMLEIFFDDDVYAKREDLARLSDFGRTSEKSQRYVLSTRKPADDLYGLLEAHRDRMENLNLILRDQEKRHRWLEELRQIPGIAVCSSTPNNIEIGDARTSKAAALEVLACHFGLGREHVMAFGDSDNDAPMLRCAGIGVAVANAEEELLELADYIAPSHDRDGVAWALEHLLGI